MAVEQEIILMVNEGRQDLTLQEAVAEYRALKLRLEDGTLWAKHILSLGENRLNFLRTLITNFVCEVKNE
jgi:hypothetical protein